RGVRVGEFGPARHVFGVTIAKGGAHLQLLIRARLERRLRGQHFDALNAWVLSAWSRRAAGNPVRQDAVFERVRREPLAAFMRDCSGGFEQEEASTRIAWHNPASQGVARQGQEIAFVVVAAEREFEAVLAGGSPVTGARVA